ncbi:hypothetical protein FOB64_000066 [Candida albicans]|uniref:AB hydrolase-1 domain-containing protein n=1 Tax=Candida albicans TaxID=5476 RepID=A0A8H6C669_CANAX|nr:hypothetical protein FOB64_000066 [Candida albicans]
MKFATTGDFQNNLESRNLIIGHSMGGFNSLYATFLEPSLFDAVIPIEAVIYGAPGGLEKFSKKFSKISKLLIDTFDSKDDINFFFKEFSFFKNMQDQVSDDFINDEVYEIKDKESGEIKYKLKCNTPHQMAAYYGAFSRFHLVWAINKEFLAGKVDVPKGEHLLNVELPDETIDIIQNFTTERTKAFIEARNNLPEVKLNNNKEAIAKEQFQNLIDLKFDQVNGYFIEDRVDNYEALQKLAKL